VKAKSIEMCIRVKSGNILRVHVDRKGIRSERVKSGNIINMRSPRLVKEAQQLTRRMVALSRFLAKSGDKGHPYFQCLRKNEKFQWSTESEQAFLRLKEYLSQPSVLNRPEQGHLLQLYLTDTKYAINSALV